MADSPSHEWEGTPRVLVRRAADTRMAGNSRGGHKTVTEEERYKTPSPTKIVTGLEQREKDEKAKDKADAKAVHAAENKSVAAKKAATK